MSDLKKSIYEKIINPYNTTKYDSVLATVTKYDSITNRASIVFEDPNIRAKMVLDNVPVQLGSGGIHSAGPFINDQVYVTFQNSSPLLPKIVALADEYYTLNTRETLKHQDKGAYLPSVDLDSIDLTTTDISDSGVNSWINSTESYQYLQYKDTFPIEDLEEKAQKVSYYAQSDPGITHPLTKSTVRIRENGCIDIFVGLNEGIRINPSIKSISMYTNNWTVEADTLNINCKSFNITGDIYLKGKLNTVKTNEARGEVNKDGF